MSTLTACLKKAGKNISKADREEILAAAQKYRADGLSNHDAAVKAVADQIAKVDALIARGGEPEPVAQAAAAAAAPTPTLDELRAAADAAKPLTEAHSAAISTLQDAMVADAQKALDAGEMPVYRNSRGNLLVTISPSAQKPGQLQLTRYISDRGVVGDSQYNSLEDVIRQEGLTNWTRLSAADAEEAMQGPLAAEAEYQQRRADAEKALAAPAATHEDPGEKPEPATASVVDDSLKTAAKREERTPAQMRADLLGMIDEAIAQAADELPDGAMPKFGKVITYQGRKEFEATMPKDNGLTARVLIRESGQDGATAWALYPNSDRRAKPLDFVSDKAMGEQRVTAYLRGAEWHSGGGPSGHWTFTAKGRPDEWYVTFDVPGDGKFKVLKTKARLQEFREQVATGPAFRESKKPTHTRTNDKGTPFGVQSDSGTARTAVQNMVEEGDYQAALDYATAKDVALDSLKLTKDDQAKWDAFLKNARATEAIEEKPAESTTTPAPAAEKPSDDMRGYAWALVKNGKVVRSGSLPAPEFAPEAADTKQSYYREMADRDGADLYIGGYPGVAAWEPQGHLIFGMTWDELQAKQQRAASRGNSLPEGKMPKDAVLAYSPAAPAAEKESPKESKDEELPKPPPLKPGLAGLEQVARIYIEAGRPYEDFSVGYKGYYHDSHEFNEGRHTDVAKLREALAAAGYDQQQGALAHWFRDLKAKIEGKPRDARAIVRELAAARPFGKFEDVRADAAEAVRKELGQQAVSDLNAGFLRNDMAEAVHAGQYQGIREWAAKQPVPILEIQISHEAAMRAHAGTSHSPDERGRGEIRDYVRTLAAVWRGIEAKYAAADEATQERVREQFQKLRDGYAQRTNAYLSAHANVMSSMIAGPARFPVASNRKKSETADRRAQEAQDYLAKGRKAIARAFAGPVDASLTSELASIGKRIADAEALQEKMKAANAALRKGDDAALAALGFDEARIAALKKPDFAGRTGFADFTLKNNNAEIRRLKERQADVQKRIAGAEAAAAQQEDEPQQAGGPRIVQDAEANRVRILFDGKPDEATRTALKSAGFRWSPTNSAWQRQLTTAAVREAERIVATLKQPDAPQFRRGTAASGSRAEAIQSFVDRITSKWTNAPDVVVVESMQDPKVPEAVREADAAQRSQDADEVVHGFHYEGKVYLVAEGLPDVDTALTTLAHEALGHYGLRGTFGDGLKPILQQVVAMRRKEVLAKARDYGMPVTAEAVRAELGKGATDADVKRVIDMRLLYAAEEVLAEMAQETPNLGFVKRAIAAIRTFLRDTLGLKLELTDEEMVRNFILPARGWVVRGEGTGAHQPEATTQFSRGGAAQPAGTNPATAQPLHAQIMQAMNDTFSAPGKLNWWHKTVGTQYNLAQRNPLFKRVFDGVQNFLNDVSLYATEAADLAPQILPKLETWRDIGKRPIAPEDNKAVSAPIFEGTLLWARDERGRPVKVEDLRTQAAGISAEAKAQRMLRAGAISENVLKMWKGLPVDQYEQAVATRFDSQMLRAGVVWKPEELKSQFGLTGEQQADGKWSGQIGLYQEFRAAVDRSLTQLAVSDMVRFAGKDVPAAARQEALESQDVDAAALILRDALLKAAEDQPDRNELLIDTAERVIEKADRARDLMDRGYAPLSRFGHYTVDVIDENGERVFFGMFETPREAALAARKMKNEFPKATITRGTVSQEEYKLFAGVSPETVELFGELLGLESQGDDAASKAFQTYIKVAKANRSAMKRLIERKGIAGFSEDVGRVLAGFVYSNARQTSQNLHMGEMTDAAAAITDPEQGGSKANGELKDQAVKLVEYVKNPQEEAQGFRGLLFAQYLGGSVASAIVNMLQPVQMTFPYLAQFGGVKNAAAQLTRAYGDVRKKTTGDTALDAALKKAEEEGIVAPQEVHQLIAQAQGRGLLKTGDGTAMGNASARARNAFSRLSLAWGKIFSAAEQLNRRATFIAAYRTGVEQKVADPAAFAEKAVNETQGTYNKGNKPNWARGAVGSTLFTFKQYSIAYMELLHRMATQGGPDGKKAALLMLGMLFLMSGAGGLPFAEDAEDLVDGVMQRLGYNFSTKLAKKQFFEKLLGKELGRFAEHGLSGLPGVPIDVSGRLGLGNLIPGTGLLVDKEDHTRDVTEFAGAGGDFVSRIFKGANKAAQGDFFDAAKEVSPRASANAVKALEMYSTGQYKDDRGRKVIDVDGFDAAMKALGFQPTDVARVQEATGLQQRLIAGGKQAESRFAEAWAKAVAEGDQKALADVREQIQSWNTANPESPVRINRSQIAKRVQALREDKATRIAKTAPKEIRGQVRQALEMQ